MNDGSGIVSLYDILRFVFAFMALYCGLEELPGTGLKLDS